MAESSDYIYMARALMLAERGLYTTDPNPRVGCVLVRDGVVVGEGWHVRAGEPHAEVHALRAAGEAARGATAYVTLEPCSHHGRTPPCADALIAAGVARVVVAMQDPDPRVAGRGVAQLRAAGIAVTENILSDAALQLNCGFVSRHGRGRPYVRAKVAMSLDGRTALANGESRWITSAAARRDGHRLRARSSAVVTGVATVLADDPALTVRHVETTRQPLRVVLDSHARTPPTARVLQGAGRAWIVTAVATDAAQAALESTGATVMAIPGVTGQVDLAGLLQCLAQRGCNEVLVEAGARLTGAFLVARLLDEVVFYLAPTVLGDAARGVFTLPGLERMEQRPNFRISDVRAVGDDWRVTAIPLY